MSTSRIQNDELSFQVPKRDTLNAAADDNCLPEWQASLDRLGFTVVCVQLPRCQRAFENAGFGESVGTEMQSAELGHFDSVQYKSRPAFFFYVATPRLADALQFLKADLEKRGLLDISAIGQCDASEKCWREFWPGLTKP